MKEEKIISFNYDKLIERIIEKFKTIENFASKISIDVTTIVNKLNGDVDFKSKEIFKFCELLEIPLDEIYKFFYQTS